MSYLCWLCLSLPLCVCRRAHVLFVCCVVSYLCWLCLSLPLGVCRRAHVLFVLVVFCLYL